MGAAGGRCHEHVEGERRAGERAQLLEARLDLARRGHAVGQGGIPYCLRRLDQLERVPSPEDLKGGDM